MADASTDSNGAKTLLAVSDVDGITPVRVYADPATHRLKVVGLAVTAGFQQPTGTVNGSNAVFVFVSAPNVISVDHATFQKTSSDGTANWTGTTTITLAVAPNTDIFGIA